MDLTPRPVADSGSRRRRRWLPIAVLTVVIAAGGVIVTQFLTSAIDYYCNVDEIGAKDGCEAGRRLRVQGVVDEGTVSEEGTATTFSISFGAVSMPVRYEGEPGGIFKECIPVVVHGVLENGVFDGDRIEVKHSNEYKAENPDRVAADDGESKGSACSPSA